MYLNQSKLQRQMEILVTNGKLPQAQAVLAGVGYDTAELDAGEALLQTWRNSKAEAKSLLVAQKQSTKAEKAARKAANREVSNFKGTVRVLFGDDDLVLTMLGLRPRQSSNGNGLSETEGENGEPNGNGKTNPYPTNTAATIAHWRELFVNVWKLSEEQLARLAKAGWTTERLNATIALVEAFAGADTVQQQAIRDYRAKSVEAREAEAALRRWYTEAVKLVRLAIKSVDPNDHEQLRNLLGL